jgi:rhamnopyranosyl-N-acetylglucosaminyl-diphospho-decaprenol beta-1,3/1,4-galactofuranosyltransferase
MKIIAVVVTYNRLPLLKKCVQAINQQTLQPDEVIIINNGSTDGTQDYLTTCPYPSYTQLNKGGAWGFYTGIKKAYEQGADWIWLMDDDTIAQPQALQQLVAALHQLQAHQQRIGFLSSKVLWTDGSLHKMNCTWPLRKEETQTAFSTTVQNNYTQIKFGTFVSMLLSARAVEQVGLPIKEFFIWSDDVEYTKRIRLSGLSGLAVPDSIVVHETPVNHESSVFRDQSKDIWKYRYGLRNELYVKRQHEGPQAFWRTWMWRMFVWPLLIIKDRKKHRWAYLKVIWQTCFTSFFFHPVAEKVDSRVRTRTSSTNEEPVSVIQAHYNN